MLPFVLLDLVCGSRDTLPALHLLYRLVGGVRVVPAPRQHLRCFVRLVRFVLPGAGGQRRRSLLLLVRCRRPLRLEGCPVPVVLRAVGVSVRAVYVLTAYLCPGPRLWWVPLTLPRIRAE
jgi:hypothetical protein